MAEKVGQLQEERECAVKSGASGGETSGDCSKVWPRSKRSDIWKFMVKVKKSDGSYVARCKLCNGEFSCHATHTASNLRDHLERKHKECGMAKVAGPGQQRLQAYFKASSNSLLKEPLTATRGMEIMKSLFEWFCLDIRPLSIAQGRGFQRFLTDAEPRYKIPSRTHLTKRLQKMHHDGRKLVSDVLSRASHVSLTTDGWMSKALQSYATYTVHFINDELWKLQSCVLETSLFPGSHTAHAIAVACTNAVKNTGMPTGKVVALVHDEAATMEAAGRKLKEEEGWLSEACAAHRLQTAITHALQHVRSVQVVLARARKLVGH